MALWINDWILRRLSLREWYVNWCFSEFSGGFLWILVMLLMFFFCVFRSHHRNPTIFPRWNPWLDEFGRWAELESRPRLDAGKFPPVLCDFVAQCLRRDDTKCLGTKQKSPGRWRFQDWDFGESTLYTNKNWLTAPDTPPKMVPFLPESLENSMEHGCISNRIVFFQ